MRTVGPSSHHGPSTSQQHCVQYCRQANGAFGGRRHPCRRRSTLLTTGGEKMVLERSSDQLIEQDTTLAGCSDGRCACRSCFHDQNPVSLLLDRARRREWAELSVASRSDHFGRPTRKKPRHGLTTVAFVQNGSIRVRRAWHRAVSRPPSPTKSAGACFCFSPVLVAAKMDASTDHRQDPNLKMDIFEIRKRRRIFSSGHVWILQAYCFSSNVKQCIGAHLRKTVYETANEIVNILFYFVVGSISIDSRSVWIIFDTPKK